MRLLRYAAINDAMIAPQVVVSPSTKPSLMSVNPRSTCTALVAVEVAITATNLTTNAMCTSAGQNKTRVVPMTNPPPTPTSNTDPHSTRKHIDQIAGPVQIAGLLLSATAPTANSKTAAHANCTPTPTTGCTPLILCLANSDAQAPHNTAASTANIPGICCGEARNTPENTPARAPNATTMANTVLRGTLTPVIHGVSAAVASGSEENSTAVVEEAMDRSAQNNSP